MNFKNGSCKHIVLFGTFNESKYFLGEFKDKFDTICFNANMIAHAPEGVAAFISQLSNKSFFIDPQLHAFQHSPKTIMRKKDGQLVLKSSIKKLAQQYNLIPPDTEGVRQILAGSLAPKEMSGICESILKFQFNYIYEISKNLDTHEFLEDVEIKPEFLIAPYFYIDPDNFELALNNNIDFIGISKDLSKNEVLGSIPLFAEIVINKEVLLNEENTRKIIERYSASGTDGFIVWIDNMSENSDLTSERILKTFKKFLIDLNEQDKPIINLHGSYLSVILSGPAYHLLAGVGHGIEYGEDRSAVPVGGGVPLSKFYFPNFFKRVDYNPDAVNILLKKNWIKNTSEYYANVCSCKVCSEIIGHASNVVDGFQEFGVTKISEKNGKAYPESKAMDKSRKHYLYTKLLEYDFIRKTTNDKILSELEKNNSIAGDLKEIHSFNHLEKWIKVLNS